MQRRIPLTTNDRIRLLFRVWSAFYDHPILQRGFYARIHRAVLGAVTHERPKTVLDAGCGTGELVMSFSRLWPEARIVGLDLSGQMLDVARRKDYPARQVEFVEQSVYEIPFEAGTFDLVTNTISSHFYKEFDRALSEFYRVLTPGGTLVMGSLGNGVLRALPGPWKAELRTPHSIWRSPGLQKEMLLNAGFHVESVRTAFWPAWLYVCRK